MTDHLRGILREMIDEAECRRRQMLEEESDCPEGLNGPQSPGSVLGFLMFYGLAFSDLLALPHPDEMDLLVMGALDIAGVGLMAFMKWQTAPSSLNAPPELDVLTDCWRRLVALCGAPAVG